MAPNMGVSAAVWNGTGPSCEAGLQRESRGISQPGLVVFECGALLVLAPTGPQRKRGLHLGWNGSKDWCTRLHADDVFFNITVRQSVACNFPWTE